MGSSEIASIITAVTGLISILDKVSSASADETETVTPTVG